MGIFPNDLVGSECDTMEMAACRAEVNGDACVLYEKDLATRNDAILRFQEAMENNGVHFTIHRERNIGIQELLHECLYADLLVLDYHETFTHFEEKPPTRFLRDLLADVTCPVLLVPDHYQPIENLVILYNDDPSSVFAVKMFSYLLPELKTLESHVLSIRGADDHVSDNRMMKEFMRRHYPRAEYNIIKGFDDGQIVSFLKRRRPHSLLVLGSYQRSKKVRWFRASMADYMMMELQLPLFIAHTGQG